MLQLPPPALKHPPGLRACPLVSRGGSACMAAPAGLEPVPLLLCKPPKGGGSRPSKLPISGKSQQGHSLQGCIRMGLGHDPGAPPAKCMGTRGQELYLGQRLSQAGHLP